MSIRINLPCDGTFFLKHDIFSHPDFTVGSGVSPDRPLIRFTDLFAYATSPSVGNIACASTLPRRIPIYFTGKLENQDALTTDFSRALTNYAATALEFEQLHLMEDAVLMC